MRWSRYLPERPSTSVALGNLKQRPEALARGSWSHRHTPRHSQGPGNSATLPGRQRSRQTVACPSKGAATPLLPRPSLFNPLDQSIPLPPRPQPVPRTPRKRKRLPESRRASATSRISLHEPAVSEPLCPFPAVYHKRLHLVSNILRLQQRRP